MAERLVRNMRKDGRPGAEAGIKDAEGTQPPRAIIHPTRHGRSREGGATQTGRCKRCVLSGAYVWMGLMG